MGTVHPRATLTPGFREFLPAWVAAQSWYRGGPSALRPVGSLRFEDPDGEVGMETHLLTDGTVVYQVPLTYRGAPLAGAERSLIRTVEHSVLGTRWIYDAEADPVWARELLRLVQAGGTSEPGPERGAQARGEPLATVLLATVLLATAPLTTEELSPDTARIELNRVQPAPAPSLVMGVAGLVTGTWYPDGPDGEQVSGCLAIVYAG